MKLSTRQLALDAMLAAMCAVLGYIAIDPGPIKITFESLPILLGALLFGPVDGLLVGAIGTGIYQLLRYGVSATTLLWILPYALAGLLGGHYSKKRELSLSRKQVMLIVILCEILITLLNTGVIYADSRIYGYYFPGYISGSLLVRFGACIVKSIAFGAVLPSLITGIKKALRRR